MKCSTAEVASTSIRKRTPVYGRRTVIRLTSYSIRTGFSVWRIFQYICRCLVCITEADLKRLVAENPQTIEANDGYYHLSTESRIDADSYRIWVNSLK